MSRRALVSGATGFVGARLVNHLLADGWSVQVIARPESTTERLGPVLERIVVHRFDGTAESMRRIVGESRPSVVFHLASLFLSEHQSDDIGRMVESNLLFGTRLVEAMSLEGARCLVNTGTSWQHFEGRAYSPVNLYAATKQAFEDLLEYFVEARGMAAITLKLCDTYGPDDPRRKVIRLLRDAAHSGVVLSMSPGEQALDLVHVEDVVRAYTTAAEMLLSAPFCGHQRFSVSCGKPISLKSLVAEYERALDVKIPVAWGARPYREREVMKPRCPDPDLPDWEPRISLFDGLKAMR
jgi:nucleoside-diphosphate-sugar epimerase